jgi:DNA-binding XRE family transcriptional regulator
MADTSFVNERGVFRSVGAFFMLTPAQLMAARTVLGIKMNDLAKRLRVGSQTIVKVESEEGLARANRTTIDAFVRYYESLGVRFIEDGDRVGLTWPREAEPKR